MKPRNHDDKLSIQEQAAQWVVDLQEPSQDLLQAFALWLRESPRHVEEFLFINALWDEFDNFAAQPRIDLEKMIAEAREAHNSSNIVELQVGRQRVEETISSDASPRWSYRWPLAAAAISMLCLSFVFAWQWFPAFLGNETYTTPVGEQRTLRLKDGTVVYLNTNTRVETDFSFKSRNITLLYGEALFDVAKEPERPFRVHSDNNVIQAIGTQFNVYRQANITKVAVIEGIVGVAPDKKPKPGRLASVPGTPLDSALSDLSINPSRLTAGQEAELNPDGKVLKLAETDVRNAIAWRTRRLVFQSHSLEEVATEFNRYNRLQIQIEGDELTAKRLTGTFNADDPETLIRFLDTGQDLKISRVSNKIIIRQIN